MCQFVKTPTACHLVLSDTRVQLAITLGTQTQGSTASLTQLETPYVAGFSLIFGTESLKGLVLYLVKNKTCKPLGKCELPKSNQTLFM